MKRLFFFLLVAIGFCGACSRDDEPLNVVSFSSSDTLAVAHWNVGHFALGESMNPTFSAEEGAALSPSFVSLLDSIGADVFGVCEWSSAFTVDGGNARSLLFGAYPYSSVGHQIFYNCNGIFAKFSLLRSRDYLFVNSLYDRYARVAVFYVDSEPVLFCETHLDWDYELSTPEHRIAQIQEIISLCLPFDHAIVCGDFNVDAVTFADEYGLFWQAGFILANGGFCNFVPTYPASNPAKPLDNIVVKGFDIVGVDVFAAPELSDHCAIAAKLLFRE